MGEAIAEAKENSGWEELIASLGTIGADGPTKITEALNVASLFADLVVLEQRAFGAGRHPKTGTNVFQDIETSYTITLSVL
jgi:hypothetical protein